MQDPIGIPACFSSTNNQTGNPSAVTKSGQSVFVSVYRTKVVDQCRLITVTWCKNLLLHGISISIENTNGNSQSQYTFKMELTPWCFWRKQGSKRLMVDDNNKAVDIFWDLKSVKFNGETEPNSEYYVAVVCDEEVILLLGDLKKEAYRKTKGRPALFDPVLVSKKEHIFGKKKFTTRAKFHDKGKSHEISIECKNRANGNSSSNGVEPEMEIRVDEHLVIHVKHLQWKFRGNEFIFVNNLRLELCWDVHDWLFSPGLRHALFIFKPTLSPTCLSSPSSSSPFSSSTLTTPSSQTESYGSVEGLNATESSGFCLFLYAWKVE